jgi:hypothetical protein
VKSLPYALCLLIGGLVGWKLARLSRKATKPVRDLWEDTLDASDLTPPPDLSAPVPYRLVYTTDQFEDEPCYGEATTQPGSPCS